jgi:Na+/H+ antiporter NhaC
VLLAAIPVTPEEASGSPSGHWSSVLPPLLAILLAIFFQQLFVSLGSSVVLGAFLAYGPLPWVALPQGFETFIWANLKSGFNLYILAFTFTLLGMVHVMHHSGAAWGLVTLLFGAAKSARSTRLGIAAMGLFFFFDDYANSLVVGTTMRPVADRWRISREKLAYLVDSTSAPVAGLALISTWIAYEVGLLNDISNRLGLGYDGYAIFLILLPLRFYCVTTLVFVFVSALLGRDFGPMYRAEARALHDGTVLREGAKLLTSRTFESVQPSGDRLPPWYHAVLPLVTLVLAALIGILYFGAEAIQAAGLSFSVIDPLVWRTAFGAVGDSEAGSGKVLFLAALVGSGVCITLAISQRLLSLRQAIGAWAKGIAVVWPAVFILILAWAMKTMCADVLHTDAFLASVLGERLSPLLLPIATFLLAAGIAFATGTSWGTMGILLPVAVPLAYAMTNGDVTGPIVWLTAAAVLDGAIFGDHCSPISDTTILSATASSCDPLDHVWTQAPYAVTCMLLAGIGGYYGVAYGISVGTVYALLVAGIVAVLFILGKPLPASTENLIVTTEGHQDLQDVPEQQRDTSKQSK